MPNPWTRVTKGFVIQHRDKDCQRGCEGKGFIESDKGVEVCNCATLNFRKEFPPESPRIKVSMIRVGNRDVEQIFYKALAPVE